MNWSQALLAFCAHLAPTHSPRTIAAYERDGEALIAFIAGLSANELDHLRCRRLLSEFTAKGLSPASLARHLSCYRQWFDFLVTKGELAQNPWTLLSAPKRPKRLPNALSPDETARLLDHDGGESAQPLLSSKSRAQAIFELLYSSGLRASECAGICLKDLDLANREVRVLGKGNKERIVPIGSQAMVAIEAWLCERRVWTLADDLPQSPLFINRQGKALSVRSIQMLLAERGRESGMLSQVHPHRLRHAFASHLLQSSGDLRAVQELLGHEDIKSTQVYTHLDFQHLAKVYDQTHPRA